MQSHRLSYRSKQHKWWLNCISWLSCWTPLWSEKGSNVIDGTKSFPPALLSKHSSGKLVTIISYQTHVLYECCELIPLFSLICIFWYLCSPDAQNFKTFLHPLVWIFMGQMLEVILYPISKFVTSKWMHACKWKIMKY